MIRITVERKEHVRKFEAGLAHSRRAAAYVGIPSAGTRARQQGVLKLAMGARGERRDYLLKRAMDDVTNAQLLFLLTRGSPKRNQPPRPVIEPAIMANGREIGEELARSVKAYLGGNGEMAIRALQRTALAGQNAARKWFTDSRNKWAPNAPSTIRKKGSDRPGIDTGIMRSAIVGLVGEE